VARTAWDHEEVAGRELHGRLAIELDPAGTVPAQEEFILVVSVPLELALQPGYPHHRIVGASQIARLSGAGGLRTTASIETTRSSIRSCLQKV
jgi:hypothetical protein